MTPWTLLDSTRVPGDGGELCLYQRGAEYSIRIAGRGELMNSRSHGSEDALAELGCARLVNRVDPRLLIGGLGMGFTLAAALRHLGESAQVVVAELVPGVVAWNRDLLGDAAGQPLRDPRVSVCEKDVASVMMREAQAFDAILLDVDNGPEGLTQEDNQWLYSEAGTRGIHRSLRPAGTLAVWSAGPDPLYLLRLKKAGFNASVRTVRARPGKGSRHTIFLASKGPVI